MYLVKSASSAFWSSPDVSSSSTISAMSIVRGRRRPSSTVALGRVVLALRLARHDVSLCAFERLKIVKRVAAAKNLCWSAPKKLQNSIRSGNHCDHSDPPCSKKESAVSTCSRLIVKLSRAVCSFETRQSQACGPKLASSLAQQ